jgi:hypothetical protein
MYHHFATRDMPSTFLLEHPLLQVQVPCFVKLCLLYILRLLLCMRTLRWGLRKLDELAIEEKP